MLRQLLASLVRSQVADLRRRATGGVVILVAAAALGIALTLALVALCLWLATLMAAWQAVAIVAGSVFVVALILFLVGRSTLRRRSAQAVELERLAQALGIDAKAKAAGETSFGLIAAAMLAGFILGRRLM